MKPGRVHPSGTRVAAMGATCGWPRHVLLERRGVLPRVRHDHSAAHPLTGVSPMRRHTAHEGEATGLPACAAASVVLKLSAWDHLLMVVRWTLTVAASVVVMWLGSAFLASTAHAAATVPAA